MNFPFLYRHSAWRAFLKFRDGKHCRRRRMKMKFHHYNSTSFAIFFPQISFRRKFFMLQIGFLSLTPAYLQVSPSNKINRWGIVSSLSDVTQIFLIFIKAFLRQNDAKSEGKKLSSFFISFSFLHKT